MRQENIRRLISVISLLIISLLFGLTSKDFFTAFNLLNILRESSITGIIAVGVTFIIITAGIDLSTGALVGFASMVCAFLIYYYNVSAGLVMLVALLVGLAGGTLNGIIVSKLRVPEFIGTLSTQYLFRSMVFVFAIRESGVITNKIIEDPNILIMGGSISGIYLVTIVFLIVAVVGQMLLKKTKFGVYIYATGSNRKSAELSGINTAKIRLIVFMITGLLCGIGAIFEIGRIGSVTTDLGTGLEFQVIAATVIGGCAFSGGRGDVFGTVIGALFMSVLQNGILKYNFPTATQLIIQGVVIVIVVVFDSVYNRFAQKKILERAKNEAAELAGGEA